MTWKCPECKKEFKNENQWHSCAVLSVEDHLKNRTEEIKEIVYKLLEITTSFKNVTLNPVKTSIQIKSGSTFLSIRPKKTFVEIEFQLSHEIRSSSVCKVFPVSSNRVLHVATIESVQEVNDELIELLTEAYQTITK